MNEVRTAIVGIGIGRANGRGIAHHPRGRVTAPCDLVPERMEAFAAELPEPVKFYTNYEEMCRDSEIDAVLVGTPKQWHVPVALEAIKHGKRVLVTKLLAHSEEAARQLVAAVEAAGVVNIDLVPHGQRCAQDITAELPKGPNVWDRIANHLIECILDGKECGAPLRHGLIVQEMMEGLLRSARTGREVRF